MNQKDSGALTPRQIAGKSNRAKRKEISPEGRAALRESALRHRPWESSTGPTSTEGKRRSRWNALRHGGYAFAVLPTQVREFIVELRKAERREGLPPKTDRPLRDYLNRFSRIDSPRLVKRLERLIARRDALFTLSMLRATTARLLAEGEAMMLAKRVTIPNEQPRLTAPYPFPLTRQAFAQAVIIRLVQWRLSASAEVLIIDLYGGTWKALVRTGKGDYYEVTVAQTPDGNWSLLAVQERRK